MKRVLESGRVVVGGGATETALAIFLDDYSKTLSSRDQLAISEFAESLLIIPKQLAINAALDATDLVAKLRVVHSRSQASESNENELALK